MEDHYLQRSYNLTICLVFLHEVMVGSAIMAAVFAVAQEGGITGGGQPDPRRRATDRAVGEWEMLEIRQDRAPYALCSYAATSWADLVRDLIGGAS